MPCSCDKWPTLHWRGPNCDEEARRLAEFQQAMDHRFDTDESADLILETEDPVLRAAVRLVNEFGGWHEITIEPSAEFLAVIQMCQEEA